MKKSKIKGARGKPQEGHVPILHERRLRPSLKVQKKVRSLTSIVHQESKRRTLGMTNGLTQPGTSSKGPEAVIWAARPELLGVQVILGSAVQNSKTE